MADPFTMAAIGMAASAASAGVSAVGSMQAGDASAKAYQYQAGVAEVNKKIAQQNADYQLKTGDTEAQQYGMKSKFQQGTIRAGQASSGFDVDTGTNARVQDSQSRISRIDQSQIRTNAGRRAYAYDVEAYNKGASADMARSSASNAETAGQIGALSSIVGGVSSVATKWSTASQNGLFGSANTTYISKPGDY